MEQIRLQPGDVEYHEAFASLRAAKNWFWWLILLAVLVNLASVGIVRWWPGLRQSSSFQAQAPASVTPPAKAPQTQPTTEPTTAVATTTPATIPTSKPTSTANADKDARTFACIYATMGWTLPVARGLGLICALLLAISLATSLNIVLAGRLGGAGYLASAFVWSIVLAALLVPWAQLFTGVAIPGVLFDRAELIAKARHIESAVLVDQILFYARFIGYPVLALLIWLVIQLKYAAGFRQVAVEVTPKK